MKNIGWNIQLCLFALQKACGKGIYKKKRKAVVFDIYGWKDKEEDPFVIARPVYQEYLNKVELDIRNRVTQRTMPAIRNQINGAIKQQMDK